MSNSSTIAAVQAALPLTPPAPPRLSLCLPTYKRAPLLRQALEAVLTQIGPDEAAQVDVLVLDNASPDDTPGVIAEAGRRWPHIGLRSVRHPQNIGMDGNFLEAIQQAQGRFVCLLSDDDILLPGAVAKLLGLIQAYPDFDGFCLNVRSFRDDPFEEAPPRLDISEDKIIRDRDEMLRLLKGSVTFLSILAFNKARIAGHLAADGYRNRIGTFCAQGYLFLDIIAAGNGIVVLAEPLVAQRVENAHALNYFQVFITEIHSLLAYAQQIGFSRPVIRGIEAENLMQTRHFVSRVMIYGRERELWSSRGDAIRRLFQVYGFHPYLWLVLVPLMFFPRPLRPLVFKIRRLLGRPEALTGKTGQDG